MTSTPEKMSGTSLDIAADQRARLKQLFPTVFTETVNEAGKLVESIDFEKLKANAVQTFAARNMGKEKHNQIVFKTV